MAFKTNRNAVLSCIFLTYFIFAILLNSVGTVILQVIHNYGVNKELASVLEPCKDLTIAFVSFACASFLPRLGYKKSMMIGLGLVGLMSLAMPLLPSFLMTELMFVVIGVAFALVKVSVYSTVGLIAGDKKKHVLLVSTMEGVFMIGVLAGSWLFGFFIGSGETASTAWLDVYWVISGLCAFAILCLAMTRFDEAGSRPEVEVNAWQAFLGNWKLLRHMLALVFVVSAFLYVMIEQGIQTWLPTFNHEILRLPSDMSVQAASIYGACLAIGRLSAGAVMHRFNWYWVLNICIVILGALILISMPLTRGLGPNAQMSWLHAPLAVYIFPLIGLFLAPIYPTINSVMLSALPTWQHSAMTGLIVVFSALGGTTGSIITGFVFSRFTGQTAFYLSLVPLTGILIALYFFHKLAEHHGQGDHPDVAAENEKDPGFAVEN